MKVHVRYLISWWVSWFCLWRSEFWTWIKDWFSHLSSDVAICRSVLMRISAFFRGRNALSNVWKDTWAKPQGVATFVLELGQNLNFSENSKGIVCAHDSTIYEKDRKNPQQPISTVIVDVHLHCVSKKNIPDVFSFNSRKHWWIFIIFGRNVTEKASNHMLLHFPTSPN